MQLCSRQLASHTSKFNSKTNSMENAPEIEFISLLGYIWSGDVKAGCLASGVKLQILKGN